MNKKQLIFSILLCLAFVGAIAGTSFCSEKSEALGISENEYKKLVIFSKKAIAVKSEMERSGGLSYIEVKHILGKPEAIYSKNEE